jgi:hypothetical protein
VVTVVQHGIAVEAWQRCQTRLPSFLLYRSRVLDLDSVGQATRSGSIKGRCWPNFPLAAQGQMNISSDTTDGLPSKCHVCGKTVWTTPLTPFDDGMCPHCGTLLWFGEASKHVGDPIQRLAQLGADVQVDAEGEVQLIRFSGRSYDDSVIHQLAELHEIPVMDIRDTAITASGATRLKRLLPHVSIVY